MKEQCTILERQKDQHRAEEVTRLVDLNRKTTEHLNEAESHIRRLRLEMQEAVEQHRNVEGALRNENAGLRNENDQVRAR